MSESISEARTFLQGRYQPLYGLAAQSELAGKVVLALSVLVALGVLASNEYLVPRLTVGLMVVGVGFGAFMSGRLAAAILRAFADTALWNAPGLTDDEKIAVAKGLASGAATAAPKVGLW